eukprot:CAMPEP_0201579976 /NCGR_PEP_ID=MMETSP0190_2-20130828/29962_1 /ASSEMBLY_ACC=CAM_ASM_000263 /TAXON_ID=37353 /ORGANISM="Rosalina sp." /LENGTH=350 /DNA_ID=CAMNT_0048015187 /DNA_START=195 /DNA_END=1247 /DNA_ORIENTATION=-
MAYKLHKVIRKQVSWKEYDFGKNTQHFDVSPIVDPQHYLNIYLVTGQGTVDNGKSHNGMLLGNCPWPGFVTSRDYDGCTLCYKVFGDASAKYIRDTWKKDLGIPEANFNGYTDTHGRTATHEIGHYLNLYHPWGNKNIDANWNGDQTCWEDTVDDTPQTMGPHGGCPATNPAFNNYDYTHSCDGSKDQYVNFMDYSDGECKTMFTKGQLERTLSMMNQAWPKGRQGLVNYQSRSEHLQGTRFVNDLYFTVTSETQESKICGPSDELVHNFGTAVDNGRVYACVSTTDNPYVDVIGDVSLKSVITGTNPGNNCIATLESDSYACFDKVPFTDSSRMTVDQVQQKLENLFLS